MKTSELKPKRSGRVRCIDLLDQSVLILGPNCPEYKRRAMEMYADAIIAVDAANSVTVVKDRDLRLTQRLRQSAALRDAVAILSKPSLGERPYEYDRSRLCTVRGRTLPMEIRR